MIHKDIITLTGVYYLELFRLVLLTKLLEYGEDGSHVQSLLEDIYSVILGVHMKR